MKEGDSLCDSVSVEYNITKKMEQLNSSDHTSAEEKTDVRKPEQIEESDGDVLINPDPDEFELNLTDLPEEILIHIASFVESRVIISALYGTCRLFYALFSDERYWKTRIAQTFHKSYPIFETKGFNWRRACMEREELHDLWSNPGKNFDHFIVNQGFFAAVDVVHLMKEGRYLVTGSRDRYMNILDLSKHSTEAQQQSDDFTVFHDDKTHKGWVWSMASQGDSLVTGSWDTYIRMWDTGDGNVALTYDKKLKTPVLGLYYEPNFIAAGGFDKRLHMFDPRSPDEPMRKCYHTHPLLCVTGDDKYIISGSEDKVISIYDRTAGKKYKQIKMESMVLSLSYGGGQLWVGDKQGNLRVLDARDALFDENNIQTIDVGHSGKLTGLIHTDGGVFTCCSDSKVKVIEPCLDADVITTLNAHSGEVAGISYNNGVLASAGADITVGVWLPKTRAF
ncbi:F-box/WD repeat-containing protein 9-like [Mya arenaria]|uniref:F-box/WD repeat-containing protein 9-like n=1 Tax=Mya arenaria TaxID=6604 RepID=UPI0022E6D70A|nr:F-box/WD repeat-containing protein 9-like [Mya arenaria]